MKWSVTRTLCLVFLLAISSLTARAQDTADVLAKARPAVVTIYTTDSNGKPDAIGTGFIVRADGLILTAYHVIADAAKVEVKLEDGRSYVVQGMLGKSTAKDFAFLKVDAHDLPVLPIADSDKVRQGDRILTLGNSLGFLEETASEGIVSAVRDLQDMGTHLQLTAAISPGNSGGPVLNMQGEAVGIAEFYLTKGQALNFALAIDDVKTAWPTPGTLMRLPKVIVHVAKAPPKKSSPVRRGSRSEQDAGDIYPRSVGPYFTGDPNHLLQEAYRYLGVPYVWGGNSARGIDGSGLVRNVFGACGFGLPRLGSDQMAYGIPVPEDQLRAGDRLYFGRRTNRVGVEHTGIYIGVGRFVHASPTGRHAVIISSLGEPLYRRTYVCARR